MNQTQKRLFTYFTVAEYALWILSVTAITVSFFLFDGQSPLAFAASLVGVTSLIFCAKGNPIGQALMVVFGALYGIISYRVAYYGEMITYLGMTVPMAMVALVTWVSHPYKGNRAQVSISRISKKELGFAAGLTVVVTVGFYFVLRAFGTTNLIPSTISVTTSFFAVYLTFRRSPFYALAYAANDVVLLVLWTMVAVHDRSAIAVIICFSAFLVNDLYSFWNWRRMERFQKQLQ